MNETGRRRLSRVGSFGSPSTPLQGSVYPQTIHKILGAASVLFVSHDPADEGAESPVDPPPGVHRPLLELGWAPDVSTEPQVAEAQELLDRRFGLVAARSLIGAQEAHHGDLCAVLEVQQDAETYRRERELGYRLPGFRAVGAVARGEKGFGAVVSSSGLGGEGRSGSCQ